MFKNNIIGNKPAFIDLSTIKSQDLLGARTIDAIFSKFDFLNSMRIIKSALNDVDRYEFNKEGFFCKTCQSYLIPLLQSIVGVFSHSVSHIQDKYIPVNLEINVNYPLSDSELLDIDTFLRSDFGKT